MSKKKFANRQLSQTVPVTPTNLKPLPATTDYHRMASWFVVLLLILPIIFSRESQDPAITPRYILLGSFVGLFTLFFYFFKKNGQSIPITPLVKYIFFTGLGLAAWSLGCLMLAVNPTAGIYDILRQLLNLVLLFLVTAMVAGAPGVTSAICKIFVVVALSQSFVGILQYYDVAFQNLPGANAMPFGLMANRNLFGSAQALVIPFVVFVLYNENKQWKYLSSAALVALITSLIVSQTRAAWLAALAIFVVSLLLVVIFSAANRKKWSLGALIVAGLTIVIGSMLLAVDKEGKLSQEVKERTASLVNAGSDSAHSTETMNDRLKVWKKTTDLVMDHPVSGVGLGNWKLNILSYGSGGVSWSAGNYVPDRVHNVYLQMTAETGFPGVVLYLSFWLLIAWAGGKVIIKPASESQRILMILMIAGLTAFAVDSMFSFPTERIEHMLYVMLMAGFILGNFLANNKDVALSARLPKWLPVIFILVAFLNVIMGIKRFSFEKNLKYAIAYDMEGRYPEVQSHVAAGKNSWINVDQLGQSLEARNGIAYRGQKNYEMALKEMNTAMRLNPNSAMVYNNMGTIYTEMNDFKKAIPYYERALQLTPDFDIVKKNLAYNYYRVGNYGATIKTLSKVDVSGDQFLNNMLNDAKNKAGVKP
jgi:O-antigen ligase